MSSSSSSPREMLEKITICGIETLSRSLHANSYLQLLTEREACYLVVDESLLIKNSLRLQDTEHRPAVLTMRIQADSQRHAHFQKSRPTCMRSSMCLTGGSWAIKPTGPSPPTTLNLIRKFPQKSHPLSEYGLSCQKNIPLHRAGYQKGLPRAS